MHRRGAAPAAAALGHAAARPRAKTERRPATAQENGAATAVDDARESARGSPLAAAIIAIMAAVAAEAGGWELEHVVRCHARSASTPDARTIVWGACVLSADTDWPVPGGAPAAGAWTATCGEDSVVVLDAVRGEVVLKYRHPEREDFYAVVATVLTQAPGTTARATGAPLRLPVLAAAGGAGTIKLISPAHRVCYAELKGHRKNVNALLFHPANPRRLFSASSDATIQAWDIGELHQAVPAKYAAVCARRRSLL